MSQVYYCDIDFGRQYHLPGVEPPRAPASTFSAQRYDPLRLPSPLFVGDGTTEPRFLDVQEMVLAEMPPALASSLAFPQPHPVLSMNSTRSDGYAGDLGLGGRETWVQKLRNSYEIAGKCVCLTWRGITTCFLASRASFHNAVQCLCDAIMRAVEPLVGVVRGMIPERAPVTRVALQ
ncbi:hypothetical protein AGABI1DRAFT_130763 [Agaricus bisporus var. burnettii JB137-S8]|uniref:Uncharacterized protein n=1 Tax=Agaricus bisporus var. burnettii (strain JB137-S8 / ATCC MYA-4627 / FGSC 10392) TaxID=597362 RepID=K5VRE0_AGABU|nr:uncharacterized protein AGABI1DRAFT_130763 [Agaricus bisporus var. burnettii JB137-S8]EKM77039.1 hypothetical protein AGABI1DRAFT_130763 [Agaricus bisporus var. burnettii JB137-S8]